MEVVKKTDDYTVVKKRSGRYGVMNNQKKWLNGDDKVKALLEQGLITAPKAKAPKAEEAPAEEAKTEEAKTEEA